MSDFAKKLKAACDANDAEGLLSFEVDAWGDPAIPAKGNEKAVPAKPFIVYHKPRTLRHAEIVNARSDGDSNAAIVWSIILEALDKEGKPLFDIGDKEFLMTKQHPQVLIHISSELCTYKGVDALKKP